MNNMSIWNQVCVTDPDMTDRINFGAFKFTTIDSMYQVQKATEVLGPCGTGWGVRNQQLEILHVDATDPHYNLLMYTAELWYVLDGKEGRYDIAADTELFEYSAKNSKWSRVSDPVKKVRTAALSKGLSWLGFNADVFLGKFDDARYVDGLRKEKQAEARAQQPPKRPAPAVAPVTETKAIQPSSIISPASEGQKAQIQALCKDLAWDGKALLQYMQGFDTAWAWGALTTEQAADTILRLNEVKAAAEPLPGSPLARQEEDLRKARELSAEFERERQAEAGAEAVA